MRADGGLDRHAYTFCMLDELQTALRRRDLFVSPSWRYADPRAGLLAGTEWEAARPTFCRKLGLPSDPQVALAALSTELDQTHRTVASRLPDNPAARFEKGELILSPLDRLDEPVGLEDTTGLSWHAAQ